MIFAICLIVVGVVFLLKNVGVITGDAWDIIWPLLIIYLGLSMIIRRKNPESKWGWCWPRMCYDEERSREFHRKMGTKEDEK
ncbi:hypothetical protein ISS37_06475 [candidate division KSB1 bacterium]|nr:hypothetical protein [candidate division KSB1 bacterium]